MSQSICITPMTASSQPHKGVGARLVRRLGGAVCNAIAGGLVHAGVLRRRSAETQRRNGHGSAAGDADTRTAPMRAPRARRPRTAVSVPTAEPARPGLLARWLGGGRSASCRARSIDCRESPFTPETCPGFPPEFYEFLNTPLEQCDPAIVHLLFAALAAHIAETLPPELGMGDAREVFAKLSGRLGGFCGDLVPDAFGAVEPGAAPAAPVAASADAPAFPPEASPDVPVGLPDTARESHLAALEGNVVSASIDTLEAGTDTNALPPPEDLVGVPLAICPAEAAPDTLVAVPFVPQSGACRGSNDAPAAVHGAIGQVMHCLAARAWLRSRRSSWRRCFAFPAGEMISPIRHALFMSIKASTAPLRQLCYATRASPF